MWLIATYEPTSLFSLRYSEATSAGAKSLLVPSPYTIKMALIVAAIRWQGIEFAREHFAWLRDLTIKVRPSRYAVVNRCFVKYQKRNEEKSAKPKDDPNYTPPIGYSPTVGFREYVYLHGSIDIAFLLSEEDSRESLLRQMLLRVDSFGKRGSFFQFVQTETCEVLPDQYSQRFSLESGNFGRLVQLLDDMASSSTFEKIDVTDDTAKVQRKERVTEITLINLRAHRFAASWAAYSRETAP